MSMQKLEKIWGQIMMWVVIGLVVYLIADVIYQIYVYKKQIFVFSAPLSVCVIATIGVDALKVVLAAIVYAVGLVILRLFH